MKLYTWNPGGAGSIRVMRILDLYFLVLRSHGSIDPIRVLRQWLRSKFVVDNGKTDPEDCGVRFRANLHLTAVLAPYWTALRSRLLTTCRNMSGSVTSPVPPKTSVWIRSASREPSSSMMSTSSCTLSATFTAERLGWNSRESKHDSVRSASTNPKIWTSTG